MRRRQRFHCSALLTIAGTATPGAVSLAGDRPLTYADLYADRIRTPLLIQCYDQDEAVPWYQGIELYLACRRLQKECIFLQYRDEPHHLKKYPNKLDYSVKMKEFFDHHLKDEPAPEWMTDGIPYRGE